MTRTGAALLLPMLVAGCVATSPPARVAEVAELVKGTGIPIGYLNPSELPASDRLLPPPPAQGSAALAADLEAHRALAPLRQGLRWQQAQADAELLAYPRALQSFACVLGTPISEQATPHLNMLLRRAGADAGLATYAAKRAHQRRRPFVALAEPSCTPKDEPVLAADGSYPSGHAAVGWAWGALLAGLVPSRSDVFLQRGRDFGNSRMVCAVHWASDVEAGRVVAAATLARLEANATFRQQRDLARQEVERALTHARALPMPGCSQP